MHNSGLLKNSQVLSDQTLTYALLLAFNKHISTHWIYRLLYLNILNGRKIRSIEWLQQSRLQWIVKFPILKPQPVSQPLRSL